MIEQGFLIGKGPCDSYDRFMTKRFFFNFIEPFLAGFLFAWGFPLKAIPSFFLAPLFGVALLFYRLTFFGSEKKFGRDLLRIWIFSLGAWFLGYTWIPETLRIFGEIFFPFNYLMGSFASFFILPQFFLFAVFYYFCFHFIKKEKILNFLTKPLTLAGVMVWCEEFLPQLFPTHLGHPYLSLAPYLGLAPYVGVPLFSLLSYWLVFECLNFIRFKKMVWLSLIPMALFALANFLMPLHFIPEKGKGLEVRLTQVNIESYLKLASEKGNTRAINEVFGNYIDLSLMPRLKPLDLLVWPETAYPYTVESRLWKNTGKTLPAFFIQIGQKTKADMIWGGYEWGAPANSDDFETTYNGLFHFAFSPQDGLTFQNVYHKIRLIPFGETLPFGPLNPILGSMIKNISYFKKGEKFQLFTTRKDNRFISVICYEILFSSFLREYLNHVSPPPHFLMNLTNDSWYGDTNEPLQHLFLAKWRSLEFDLPIVRSTNSGISSILYPDGTESERLVYGVKGVLDTELKLKERKPTLYERFGCWITFGAWLMLSLIFSVRWKTLRATNHASE